VRSAEAKSRFHVGAFESWLRMKITAANLHANLQTTNLQTATLT
jgi:LysR family glycine cleavage system transcriptional activator